MSFLDSAMGRRILNIAPLWWLASINDGEGASEGPEGMAPRALPLANRKVMVVEDEFFVGLELSQMLESAGAEIIGPAWSLEEARSLAQADELDMAVIDVNLNGEYAIDFAVELRKRGVRVVFATAYADDARFFSGEASTIPRLSKPTSTRALLRALQHEA